MSNTPKKDDASTGGGIGDIPAQPINPDGIGSGSTHPQRNSDGVTTHMPTGDDPDRLERQGS